jgi:3-hydroxyisobutyrate dehydrogenase
MTLRIGFVGLGMMGRPMAECLVARGLETTVFDISAHAVDALVERGAKPATSPREVAAASDVICVCVHDDAAVQSVCAGERGLFAGAARGAVVVIHSTVMPAVVESLAAAGRSHGVSVIDAPVTGGEERAREGDLTVLVAGDEASLEKARPALEAFGSKLFRCGDLGDAARMKLCVNVTTYLQWLAGYEGLRLAKASGLSSDTFLKIGGANGQITPVMQRFLTIHMLPDEVRRTEGIQRIVRGPAAVAEKDLTHALALAAERGVELAGARVLPMMLEELYGLAEERHPELPSDSGA